MWGNWELDCCLSEVVELRLMPRSRLAIEGSCGRQRAPTGKQGSSLQSTVQTSKICLYSHFRQAAQI